MLSFSRAVKAKYLIVAGTLNEDEPISQYVLMMKNCVAVGREDLSDQIKMYWRKFINKYPKYRVNPAAAAAHGMNSIKVHLFGGKEFIVWLKEQEQVAPAQVKELKAIPVLIPPKEAPAIAVPKKGETQEEWSAEAAKTKEALVAAKAAFGDVREYIAFLEKEAGDIQKKIKTYGDGGEKSKTKTGAPSEYSKRVPKWASQLEATLAQIEEAKKSLHTTETSFKAAVGDYNNAPITTVAYEKKAQAGLENILTYVLNMKDLDKQRELLVKLNTALGDDDKATASAEEIIAGDRLASLFAKFTEGLKVIKAWLNGLNKSVDAFGKLASIRY
jgi:predicted  nucleic acid-binding Zn-ribbon protein